MGPQESNKSLSAGTVDDEADAPNDESTESDSGAKGGTIQVVRDRLLSANLLILPTIIIVFVLSLLSEQFLSYGNFMNILRLASMFVILGVGQTFVITSANIDLSIGSMMALVMAVTGTLIFSGLPVALAFLFAVFAGATLGTLNGTIVTRLGVPSLLATLGGLVAYRGAVNQYMYGSYHVGFPESVVVLGRGMWGPLPVPVAIAAFCVLLGWLLMRYTRFGRYTIAIGGNEQAARLAGINVKLWKTMVFAFQGAMVGVAAMVLMGRMNAAHPSAGEMTELHVIAGVVLGGTLLFGGFGTFFGTVLGMVLIAVLENGLLLAGAGFFWQQIFLGALIVSAVAFQMFRLRMQGEYSRVPQG